MSLKDLAQPEPWMDQEERQTATTLIAAFQQNFAERQIPENPFLILRLQDCLLHYTLCRRLERALIPDSADVAAALAAHIGKARERLRKALKDLEDTANRLVPPAESGPNPARTGIRSTKSRPEIPNAINVEPGDTPQDQDQPAAPPVPPPTPAPAPPTATLSPTPPPPKPLPPTERPRPTPESIIRVPRPGPFVQQHRR